MNVNKKFVVTAITLNVLLLLLSFAKLTPYFSNREIVDKLEIQPELNIVTASFWNLTGSPIYIDDANPVYNWSKTANDNPWCSGSGTWNDPYIIENVTIDGQGLDSCIEIRNSGKFFIIRNCTLYNSGSNLDEDGGIKLHFVNNGKIYYNNCSYNNGNGLIIRYGQNISISGNNVSYNKNGIYFAYIYYRNYISDNKINNNYNYGIRLYNVYKISILNNRIHNNSDSGLSIYNCRHDIIRYNDIYNNYYSGMEIQNECRNITTSRNNISFNGNGIYFKEGRSNKIFANNVSFNIHKGITILDSELNDLTKNNVNNNEYGIYLENVNTTQILENSITNNSFIGLYLIQSNYNNITRNFFNGNSKSIEEDDCKGNDFRGNIPPFEQNGSPTPDIFIIAIIILGITTAIISVGIIVYKRKILSEKIHEALEIRRTKEEVQVEKEKHICIVHKGKIVGTVYICPNCETYYCMKCATALKKKNENCWVCNSKIKI